MTYLEDTKQQQQQFLCAFAYLKPSEQIKGKKTQALRKKTVGYMIF